METAKFLCEFFFTNPWHFLGLILVIGAMSGCLRNFKGK